MKNLCRALIRAAGDAAVVVQSNPKINRVVQSIIIYLTHCLIAYYLKKIITITAKYLKYFPLKWLQKNWMNFIIDNTEIHMKYRLLTGQINIWLGI